MALIIPLFNQNTILLKVGQQRPYGIKTPYLMGIRTRGRLPLFTLLHTKLPWILSLNAAIQKSIYSSIKQDFALRTSHIADVV